MKNLFLAFAALVFLQGPSVFAEDCCPADEAIGWKCGQTVYLCPGEPVCDKQGNDDSTYVTLTEDQCTNMKGTELGQDCIVPGYPQQGLSNRVCASGGFTHKFDGSCDTCNPVPTDEPSDMPSTPPTPSSDCPCLPENASSWKCGQNVYYCPGVDTKGFCGSQAFGDKFTQIPLTEAQCTAMKGTELNQDCVVLDASTNEPLYKPQGLSNFVCYDDEGPLFKVDDSSCDSCGGDPDPTPDPPEATTPPPEPETKGPEPTKPPLEPEPPLETCPDDVLLIKQDGLEDLPSGTIQVLEQNTDTVTVRVKQMWTTDGSLEHLFYQYYQSIFSEKCFEEQMMPEGDSIDLTIQCTHGSQIALLELWAVNYSLDYTENNAEIPQCCHADLVAETPVTQYLIEIKCVSSCPGASQ